VSIKEYLNKTTIANVVAGFLAVSGMIYFIATKNTDGVMFVTGTALGWLYKEVKQRRE